MEIPCSDAMLAALERVVEVADETDDNAAFEAPVREFWHVFFAECDARGLCDEWDPLVVLSWLVQGLLADELLPVDDRINYAAAVQTIRDLIMVYRHEQARLN